MPLSLKDNVYTYTVGSDVQRDGMYLEVSDDPKGRSVLLEIFYSDRTREMTISVFSRDVPLEAVEWAISAAKKRLPPEPDSDQDNLPLEND